jgi:CubicO group peptidase (beta-lactamase class C family)
MMTEIKGICNENFMRVREVLERNLASGADIGASAAVFIDGEPVVDIWGGYFDEAKTRAWESETIVNTFSTTKTMMALCMLILADRGEVDLDARVAKYWPDFAQNGKDEVLVRHLLGHSSGLPGWTEPVTLADICDHEKAADLLAKQAPWWKPGTAIGYHPITFGPLNNEIVRRVTGKTLKQFFAEEVARPIGADFHIGAKEEDDDRVSNIIQSAPIRPRAGEGTITDRAFFNPYVMPQDSGTIMWRRADLGGSNGHGNARSAAMVQQVLACGGEAFGKRLLSEAGCLRALETVGEGTDLVAGFPARWGMGYALNNPAVAEIFGHRLDGKRIAFWGGSGGSLVVNDLDARMTVAYVMNRHVEDQTGLGKRGIEIVRAAYDSRNAVEAKSAAV